LLNLGQREGNAEAAIGWSGENDFSPAPHLMPRPDLGSEIRHEDFDSASGNEPLDLGLMVTERVTDGEAFGVEVRVSGESTS
jgi:hypothetical protein